MQLTDENNLPEYIFRGKKFIRREELTTSIRSYIAVKGFLAMQNSRRGLITHLSRQFNVSRQFIYDTIWNLESVLSIIFNKAPSEIRSVEDKNALYHILSLRLEGKCSIEAISSFMKRFRLPSNSTGFISQYLNQTGSLLPDTLITGVGDVRLAVFASDEIFSKGNPILVTVEPVSSAILKIELLPTRKAEDWIRHWNCIERDGHTAIYMVSDEGRGLVSGHSKGLSDVPWQPDTFHAIAHRLGIWVDRFEKSAYHAITEEYKRLKTIGSAKSQRVLSKRIKAYEAAVKASHKNIELYEQFKYLYTETIKELHIFDANGNLRERKESEENIRIFLDLIDTLEIKTLSESINKIRKTVPELLNYFDHASAIVKVLKESIYNEDALKALCAGWQYHKMYIKSKRVVNRHYYRDNEAFCLEIATGYLQENFEIIKEQVYSDLNHIVQSSAMVECMNSIIRPYLNGSRNQISQEMLNLIMFYHNHRRYRSGERALKTPYEILSGKQQEKDWMELLFETIGDNDTPIGNCQKYLSPVVLPACDKKHHGIVCYRSSDDYTLDLKLSR